MGIYSVLFGERAGGPDAGPLFIGALPTRLVLFVLEALKIGVTCRDVAVADAEDSSEPCGLQLALQDRVPLVEVARRIPLASGVLLILLLVQLLQREAHQILSSLPVAEPLPILRREELNQHKDLITAGRIV